MLDAVFDEDSLLVSRTQHVVRSVQHSRVALQLQRQKSLLLEVSDVCNALLEQDLLELLRSRAGAPADFVEHQTLLVFCHGI